MSDSEESLIELPDEAGTQPRRSSLLSPRMPQLHSIKQPFSLVLGGILVEPPRVPWTLDQ